MPGRPCGEIPTFNQSEIWSVVSASISQIGYLYEYDLSAYAPGVSAPWQQHFFTQALGYGSDLEALLNVNPWYEILKWNYKGIIGILGNG